MEEKYFLTDVQIAALLVNELRLLQYDYIHAELRSYSEDEIIKSFIWQNGRRLRHPEEKIREIFDQIKEPALCTCTSVKGDVTYRIGEISINYLHGNLLKAIKSRIEKGTLKLQDKHKCLGKCNRMISYDFCFCNECQKMYL